MGMGKNMGVDDGNENPRPAFPISHLVSKLMSLRQYVCYWKKDRYSWTKVTEFRHYFALLICFLVIFDTKRCPIHCESSGYLFHDVS